MSNIDIELIKNLNSKQEALEQFEKNECYSCSSKPKSIYLWYINENDPIFLFSMCGKHNKSNFYNVLELSLQDIFYLRCIA